LAAQPAVLLILSQEVGLLQGVQEVANSYVDRQQELKERRDVSLLQGVQEIANSYVDQQQEMKGRGDEIAREE